MTLAAFNTAADSIRPIEEAADELLGAAFEKIQDGMAAEGMDELVLGLRAMRDSYPTEQWHRFAQSDCLRHPIRRMVHQDPFTRRSFDKPRGYPGDAGILDLIYGVVPVPAGTTAMGSEVYSYTRWAPACDSVRARREILARTIDRLADEVERPRILSLACGHLREAQCSAAAAAGRLGAFYAVDHDAESLALIQREHAGLGITTVNNTVRGVVTGKVRYADLDLAYAAGLYDYLGLPVATAVTRALLGMTRPGGRVIVANFAPNLVDIGYMESYMAWNLIYRDEAGMQEIADGLPAAEVASSRTFRDGHGNVVYLEVTRA
ncbi:MAG TPA: hypothetical protein VKA84_17910 [Gemmatimonadaceae bacterium]|nr:hypothetical protein [Gemmatimonadaceae bacterium]